MRFATTLALCLLAQLPAQTFFIDVANAPGTNFISITAAIAAVPDGAILIVRPGTYEPFFIDQKSLTIVADGMVSVGNFGQGCTILNLLPQQQVTLRGLKFFGAITNTFVSCVDNDGPVLIDTCNGFGLYPTSGSSIEAIRCADVHVHNGTFRPVAVPLLCIESMVRLSNATLEVSSIFPGIAAHNSTIELTDCTVLGNAGAPGRGAVMLNNSTLRVLGNTTLSTTSSWPVITGIGTARLDPMTVLNSGGVPPIVPTVQATTLRMPSVAANVSAPGNIATATLDGPSNANAVLFAGLTGPARFVPPFPDPILLLPGTEIQMTAGSLSSPLIASYVLPPVSSFVGLQVTWQGASLDSTNGAQISNAASYVHY